MNYTGSIPLMEKIFMSIIFPNFALIRVHDEKLARVWNWTIFPLIEELLIISNDNTLREVF